MRSVDDRSAAVARPAVRTPKAPYRNTPWTKATGMPSRVAYTVRLTMRASPLSSGTWSHTAAPQRPYPNVVARMVRPSTRSRRRVSASASSAR
jgi:hypothetical protein